MTADILLCSESPIFARMLSLELSVYSRHTEIRSAISNILLENPEEYKVILIDLSCPIPVMDQLLKSTAKGGIPVILMGYPEDPLMSAEYMQIYESYAHCVVFMRPFLMESFLRCMKELLYSGQSALHLQNFAALMQKPYTPADDIRIDTDARAVYFREEPIELTKREYDLFLYLMQQRGSTVSRSDAFAKVWGYDYLGDTNVVDVYVRYLRLKIDEKFQCKLIHTVRGIGYMIKK